MPSANPQGLLESQSDGAEPLHPGWGPEAYKCFASNYVSSPDRLIREIRKQKRLREAELKQRMVAKRQGPSQLCKSKLNQPAMTIRAPVGTARELDFSEFDECRGDQTECRRTIGHKVNPILVREVDGN
ncbi:unnamed protein product [Phytomonas sp. Hart1]|nr:unnamed protein product [Phytomonas sp. Hart1]|eukprot:CCW68178.1 unnamed protein product [Phytomonas sp. isolate Hart1]